ncbi:hypothetical protein NBRC111894_700 [Sporolactobacillus inulinus]|uniref:Uncharacterized protein n=1 Tax=Sporolactobacillus inulinus TaxID=2078 RepID=A0A4Y1Z866_9BACL|nr:hypothetical protein NBRC111894_700 [Sporolactobacillus inulinus]
MRRQKVSAVSFTDKETFMTRLRSAGYRLNEHTLEIKRLTCIYVRDAGKFFFS